MNRNLYELFWQVETDPLSFIYREYKVFFSEAEAKEYGRRREQELNKGASIKDRAHIDGYYFKYLNSSPVEEIDGFVVKLQNDSIKLQIP